MMPTTPSGCGIRRFLAGMNCSAVATRRGAIHFFRCLAACLISPSTSKVSAIAVSVEQRWPKSAEIAASNRDLVRLDGRAQPRKPVEPLGQRRRRFGPRQLEHAGERRPPRRAAPGFSGAGPWRFLWRFLVVCPGFLGLIAREAGLLRRFWQEPSGGPIWRDKCRIRRHKIDKRSPAGLSKASLALVHTPRTRGRSPGVPSQEASGRDRSAPQALAVRFGTGFWEGAQRFIAGWSSPVARQAHNLKVIGSNPIPATKLRPLRT